jgi:site-specific DNA-methyltransferase (adenine-specific)
MPKAASRLQVSTNTIFRGENLCIMREMPDECVDLVYIDPPFFTQRTYKNIWGDKESVQDFGESARGFDDTKDYFERHIATNATGLRAYLEWLRVRLVEIHRVLKHTGSFYCHLDFHAVHYAKVIIDEIFGYKNLQNEIIWIRKHGAGPVYNRFSNNHDTILYYSKSDEFVFNKQYTACSDEKLLKQFPLVDEDGRRYQSGDTSNPAIRPNLMYEFQGYPHPKNGWRWELGKMEKFHREGRLIYPKSKTGRIRIKLYQDQHKGDPVTNIWDDIGNVQGAAKEKTGWPTQKPVALLERVIAASSNEGNIVFDAFAGCGTTMHAAHNLKRKWIGIDVSSTAAKVNEQRLKELGAVVRVVEEKEVSPHRSKKAG